MRTILRSAISVVILLLAPAWSTAGASKSYSAEKKILQIAPPGSEILSAEISSMKGDNLSSAVVSEANSFSHVKQKHLSSPQGDAVTLYLKPGKGAALLAWASNKENQKRKFNAKILMMDAQGKLKETLELTDAFLTALTLPKDPKHAAKLVIMPTTRKFIQH